MPTFTDSELAAMEANADADKAAADAQLHRARHMPANIADAKLLATYDGQRTLGQSKYAAQLVVASRHGAAAHARLLVVLAARRQGAAHELLNLGAL